MQYVLYKATSPSGRTYIGITNNFKRRMKEHGSSPYAFGKALRKYGRENFNYEFELYPDVEAALTREAELVTVEAVKSKRLYNESVGGVFSDSLRNMNPMRNPEVLSRHPNLFTSENNPMNDPEVREKAKASHEPYKKKVSIDGVVYVGVREAARQLNSYRQFVVHRLKSSNYPTWFYVKD
jgi:predicted GIY-YIG superfamily endonuclease